jgi:hypothetical protein
MFFGRLMAGDRNLRQFSTDPHFLGDGHGDQNRLLKSLLKSNQKPAMYAQTYSVWANEPVCCLTFQPNLYYIKCCSSPWNLRHLLVQTTITCGLWCRARSQYVSADDSVGQRQRWRQPTSTSYPQRSAVYSRTTSCSDALTRWPRDQIYTALRMMPSSRAPVVHMSHVTIWKQTLLKIGWMWLKKLYPIDEEFALKLSSNNPATTQLFSTIYWTTAVCR